MAEKYYNIHNIVRFKIITKSNFQWQFKNIYKSYENFESDHEENLDFIIVFGDFIPENQECTIIDNNYYIKNDYIYCKNGSYKFTNWEFEISGLEGNNVIKANILCNKFGYLWISGFIIDFLIHYKMNDKGFPMIHASCVSKDNKALLFSARGGGGKTTIAMNFIEKGFKLSGDNFIILNNDEAYSFLSPLNIFSYNLAPIIKEKFSWKDKIILSFKELFYTITLGYIKIFSTFNPKKIFPNSTIDKTKIEAITLLVPKKEINKEKINKKEFIKHLVLNQKLDTQLFMQYIIEYSYVNPDSKLSNHWKLYEKNLNKVISDEIKLNKLEVPRSYDSRTFKIIEELN